jgi:hypothetical protein
MRRLSGPISLGQSREFGMVQVIGPVLTETSILHHLQPLHCRAADPLTVDEIEQRILRTYVQLAVTAERADGSRSATLARFGALEVRLIECPQPAGPVPAEPPFWLEIYSHETGSTVDRWGCFEFDEAELATATNLVLQICTCLERELSSPGEDQSDGRPWGPPYARAGSTGARHARNGENGSFGGPRRLVHERDGGIPHADKRLTARSHAPSRGPLPLHLVL